MRAVVVTRFGGPEVLQPREVPDPVAGAEDVIVRVRATAVNRADLLQRMGRYPAPPGAPDDIPGLEFAGEVESCGESVRTLQTGDRVMGILGGGGYAEKVAVHERLCLRIPPSFGWEPAGATPEAFLTAYDALFRCGSLAAGQRVLVQAAGSGVGTAAVQLAQVAGSQVIGLSRTSAKRHRLRELGLEQVFDPGADGLAERILAATGGEGVDLVLDLVGAAAWPLHRAILSERGRMVIIGLMGGSRLEIDLFDLMRKRLTVAGSVLRSRDTLEKISLVREFGERIIPLMTGGSLGPIVHCTMDLAEAADAHRLMERNENFGKIVLRV
jgi:putative PIG3 family NAD(P)H quinone oxidoreductase